MKKLFSSIGTYLRRSDTLLLALCVLATIYGTVLIASCTGGFGSSSVRVQLLAMVIGIVVYFVFSMIDVDILAGNWIILYMASIGLLLALLRFGVAEGSNRAWIRFWGIGIQPAELGKIAFIIIMARCISKYSEERKLNNVLRLGFLLFIFASYFGLIIVISSDLGSALVYMFIFAAMLFAGGLKIYWFLIALTVAIIASPYLWEYLLRDDQRNRIIALFAPDTVDPTGLGITMQVRRSRAAIASGRIFGMGLGNGTMTQAEMVPRQRTDFIFSVAGEELGFVGCVLLVALLTAIVVRVVFVGMKCQSRLGALVAVGVAAMMSFQILMNLGMCLGVAPVVGLTLPFFSSGGSSIVTSFAAMGMVSGLRMKPKTTLFNQY